jgi:hypothetical protein
VSMRQVWGGPGGDGRWPVRFRPGRAQRLPAPARRCLPFWKESLAPQHSSRPPASRTQVWLATGGQRAGTGHAGHLQRGRRGLDRSPAPSWPSLPSPQQNTGRRSPARKLWRRPSASACGASPAAARPARAARAAIAAPPSWPDSPAPQQQHLSAVVRAQVCASPAAISTTLSSPTHHHGSIAGARLGWPFCPRSPAPQHSTRPRLMAQRATPPAPVDRPRPARAPGRAAGGRPAHRCPVARRPRGPSTRRRDPRCARSCVHPRPAPRPGPRANRTTTGARDLPCAPRPAARSGPHPSTAPRPRVARRRCGPPRR